MKNNRQIVLSFLSFCKVKINTFLKRKGFSDGYIYQLIFNKNVSVNGRIVHGKNEYLPFFPSIIKVRLNDEKSAIIPLNRQIDIVYEDDYIMVVNKEKNLDIEPSKKNNTNTLANKIQYYYDSNHIASKIHFVNRLDSMTSGLVIVAKNGYIHNIFSKTKIIKKYKALVEGKTKKKGTIKVKIKKENGSVKRIISDDGKLSISKYKRLFFDGFNSLVEVKLLTGRTHQIRVSFAHISHPLVADNLYNNNKKGTFFLQAYFVKFIHPITKKVISIKLSD